MYFDAEQTREAVERIAGLWLPAGSCSSAPRRACAGSPRTFTSGTPTGRSTTSDRPGGPPLPSTAEAAPPPPPALASDRSWFDAIARSSTRIEELARPRVAVPLPHHPPASRRCSAMALMRQERFDEALATLDPAADDTETLLLRAALLVVSGDGAAAEATCARLLGEGRPPRRRPLRDGALPGAGRGPGGGSGTRPVRRLPRSPGSRWPTSTSGLLARRSGDLGTARRELTLALSLLASEDPSRIVLFGGGFDRDGLMGVCRGELAACGSTDVNDRVSALQQAFDAPFAAAPDSGPAEADEQLLLIDVDGLSLALAVGETGGVHPCPPITPSRAVRRPSSGWSG